ncbi:MAG: LPS export ABC transporter periplasmic protein LptC [Parahaliea sp.]
MKKNLLHIILAVALLLLVGYYWEPVNKPDFDRAMYERRQILPQTYVYAMRSWEYENDGSLAEIMEADRVERFAQSDSSTLIEPRFYSHDGNDRSWSASAHTGTFAHGRGILELNDDVVLSNDQTGGTLNTSAMTINVHNKTALSNVPVTVVQGQSNIRADSMTADLNRERIVMKTNVDSTYIKPTGP